MSKPSRDSDTHSMMHDDINNEVHADGEGLHSMVQQLHEVFQDTMQAPHEIKVLLDGFEEILVTHLAHEEANGFFEAVVQRAPPLASEANRLCSEHHQLRSQVADLCQFAELGCSSDSWWRELAARCHALSDKLLVHESAENALLQSAHRWQAGA